MKAAILAVAVSTVAFAQTINPSPRAVIRDARALLPAEVAQILEAARQAVAGKAFRAAYAPGGPGIDYVMRADGRPEWMRSTSGMDVSGGVQGAAGAAVASGHVDVISIVHYTGTPARSCDGTPRGGELVIEYEKKTPPGSWTVRARTRGDVEPGGPIFELLSGSKMLASGGIRDFDGGRRARAFVTAWTPPGRSLAGPASGTESIWIDLDALLPVRWAVALTAAPDSGLPAIPEYGLSLTYDPSIVVRPPDGIAAPDCVR